MNNLVERVQNANGERSIHRRLNFFRGHPTYFASFGSWVNVPVDRTAPVDQSDNPTRQVLVNTGQTFHRDRQSGFLENLAPNTLLEGFVEF